MTYSKELLCSMAAAHCGVNEIIDDVDNDNTNLAIQCRLFFDHIVQLLHGICEWDFAMVEAPLVPVDYTQTNNLWAYAYKYPTDCVLALRIQNPAVRTPGEDQQVPFKVKNLAGGYGKVILTDMEDAILEYNTLVTNPDLWNAQFAQAVSLGVANHICMPLRVDPAIVKLVQSNFAGWLAEAVNTKQREQTDDSDPDSEFITTRG